MDVLVADHENGDDSDADNNNANADYNNDGD